LTFSQSIIEFNATLGITQALPEGVEVLNPYLITEANALSKAFYNKYYNDHLKRHFIFGINPGRFGSGLTGVPFSDPLLLSSVCGLENTLQKKPELSATYVFEVIKAYGGPEVFYSHFYITAVCPLGFTKNGINLNYYDDKQIQSALEDYIIQHIKTQLDFGAIKQKAFCLGEGKNFAYLSKLNEKHAFFDAIIPLPHPRFIMQYKRKLIPQYIDIYLQAFGK
jgi:Domain of unknown function (DUF4918)